MGGGFFCVAKPHIESYDSKKKKKNVPGRCDFFEHRFCHDRRRRSDWVHLVKRPRVVLANHRNQFRVLKWGIVSFLGRVQQKKEEKNKIKSKGRVSILGPLGREAPCSTFESQEPIWGPKMGDRSILGSCLADNTKGRVIHVGSTLSKGPV
ncbi:hypothetical protein T492DRAFT_223107 [Pavlovales sp. CCMP2436]|nr:hypothetical protein T492DRAFT_223107 [Pavlovales sp. CCMP2436]